MCVTRLRIISEVFLFRLLWTNELVVQAIRLRALRRGHTGVRPVTVAVLLVESERMWALVQERLAVNALPESEAVGLVLEVSILSRAMVTRLRFLQFRSASTVRMERQLTDRSVSELRLLHED